jgi:hypothetical protein
MTIEVPPELFAEWLAKGRAQYEQPGLIAGFVAEKAAEWAADQQLEKVCEWLKKGPYGFSIAATAPDLTGRLRAAMRPKPPSLKEQALATLQKLSKSGYPANYQPDGEWDTIRRAIESIPDADKS